MERIRTYTVWSAGDGCGYEKHRIPGILVTRRGTVLIWQEARRSAGDWALMDILLQRSENHGDSFGEPLCMARGTETLNTVNNPVMVEDARGRLHFLYCENYGTGGGRIIRRYSDDDGISWSDGTDITGDTLPEYRNCFAFGPGHGILTGSEMLLIPVWMVPKSANAPVTAHSPSVIGTFYSTDNGESWRTGEIIEATDDIPSPNETAAAELSDGRIYLNIRSRACYRSQALSPDGRGNWGDYRPVPELPDPMCFGSLAVYDRPGSPRTLLFVNCDSGKERERVRVTVRGSTDDAKTWAYRLLIDPERGGYADIAADGANDIIYVLYEDKYGQTCRLARFPYASLTAAPDLSR